MSIGSPGLAPYRQGIHAGLRQLSRHICLVVILIAVGVLAGWEWAIPWLKSGLPGLPTMRPNTALGVLLAGTALWLETDGRSNPRRYAWQSSLSLGLALVCLGLGSVSLVEFWLRWDTGLGQWLFPGWAEQLDPVSRGRLAPNTALNFVLFSGAIGLLYQRQYRRAQILALGMFYVALVGFLGYLYNVKSLYGLGSYSAMSLPTSGTFLLLAIALLLRYPDRGLVAMLTTDHAGGALVRRLVLAVGLVPVTLCGLIIVGQRRGLYSSDFGVVLLCVSVVLMLSWVTWWSSLLLERSDYYVSFDTLTGLPNRRRFEQQLSQWMAYSRQHHQLLCVLLVDIDRFKYVNDVLGHDLGDELLIHISRRIQALTSDHG
ncbi:MAG: GGDEF domain-containing protein, partial [Nodosilinea sp.]